MKWLRRTGIALGIVVVLGSVTWYWLLHTESGANRIWLMAQNATGGQLSGDAITGDFAGGATIAELSWRSDSVDVSVESVSVAVDVDLFPLIVNVVTARAGTVDIYVPDGGNVDSEPQSPGEVAAGLQLPIEIHVEELSSGPITLSRPGADPLSVDGADLSVYWHERVEIYGLDVLKDDAQASVSGTVELRDAVPLELFVSLLSPDVRADLTLRGDLYQTAFDLSVSGVPGRAFGEGELVFSDTVSVAADLTVTAFHLAQYWNGWPETEPLSGELKLEYTGNTLAVTDAVVNGASAEARVDGSYSLATGDVDAALRWSNVLWPVDSDTPQVSSDSGDVVVTGDLEDWAVNGTIAIGTEEMPEGRFVVEGQGDLDSANATILQGQAFGGSLAGDLEYSWRGDQPWRMLLDVTTISVGSLLPDWPGHVSGKVQAGGTQRPFSVVAQLDNVSGELRGRALSVNGGFAHDDRVTTATNLEVQHGGLEARLDGSADTPDGLRFDATVASIEDYVDSIQGSATVAGNLSRAGDHPYVSVNLKSPLIQAGEFSFHGIDLKDNRTDGQIAAFILNVDRAEGPGTTVTNTELGVTYSIDRQAVSLTGEQLGTSIEIGIEGAFDDWSDPANSAWNGAVSAFAIELHDEHTMRLVQPATLEVSRGSLFLRGFCAADGAGAQICADFSRGDAASLELDAKISKLPLSLIEHFVDAGVTFEQDVSGTIEWSRAAGADPSGNAELTISAGIVRSVEDPAVSVETAEGQLGFEIIGGKLLAGTAEIPMPGTGEIDAQFRVLDVARTLTSEIDGGLQISMNDVELFAQLSPLVDTLHGQLDVSLQLAGTVGEPVLTGEMRMQEGELYYGPIGMHLTELNLAGELTSERSLQVAGRFRAGDGLGEVISSADYADADAPGLRFRVRGTNLQLVDVPDLNATVAPFIDVALENGELSIDGTVEVSSARIAPANLAENRISESDDVVIVAGTLPGSEEKNTGSRLGYSGELKVTLGDDVQVDLDVAKAKVSGSTVFTWQDDPVPMADGRFDLTGSVEAFGQVLQLTEGGIRFPNVPANNPYIRIRAERDIYGNTQVKHAGILVDGPAKRPSVEAYTMPMTTEERALTLLVTGSDFDYEQGVGAVDFGTYIAPRLFVSYGVGIFDRDNVISARYDLKRGFGIKASSGSKESGVDLNYRFEN